MLIDIASAEYAGIKNYVENQWWFTSRWSTDPTISSMMVMLDDIDRHYRDWSQEQMLEVWDKLTNKNQINSGIYVSKIWKRVMTYISR